MRRNDPQGSDGSPCPRHRERRGPLDYLKQNLVSISAAFPWQQSSGSLMGGRPSHRIATWPVNSPDMDDDAKSVMPLVLAHDKFGRSQPAAETHQAKCNVHLLSRI